MEIDIYQEWSVPERRFAFGKQSVRVPYILEVPIRVKLPIRHWLDHHGFEWVQSYMKKLKVWAIRILNYERYYSVQWIRKVSYRGYVIPDYEVFRVLVDNVLANNLFVIKSILAYLNSYKICAPNRANHMDSITGVPKVIISNKLLEWYVTGVNLPHVPPQVLDPEVFIMGSRSWAMPDGTTRRGPIAKHLDHFQKNVKLVNKDSSTSSLEVSKEMKQETRVDGVITWIRPPGYKVQEGEELLPTVPLFGRDGHVIAYMTPNEDENVLNYVSQSKHLKSLGKLHVVPSQGKARVILIGDYRAQLKCKRLADFLREYLWSLPEIASGDQSKFERKVTNWLRDGYHVASVDLSDFTDRISLDAQIKVLSTMGVPYFWFNFLKYEFWFDPKDFKMPSKGPLERAIYSNGQPMGLFVSFPMAELLHYLVVRFCCLGYGSEFVICGDDLCIANKYRGALNHSIRRYKVHIERLGCKINEAKSLIGNVAEGVGKLYVRRGNTVCVISTPSGSLAPAELEINPYLRKIISSRTTLGRSIYYHLCLEPSMIKTFDRRDIHAFYEWLIKSDYSMIAADTLRKVSQSLKLCEPTSWFPLDKAPKGAIFRSFLDRKFSKKKPLIRLPKVSKKSLDDALTTTYIKKLYRRERSVTNGA